MPACPIEIPSVASSDRDLANLEFTVQKRWKDRGGRGQCSHQDIKMPRDQPWFLGCFIISEYITLLGCPRGENDIFYGLGDLIYFMFQAESHEKT